MVTVVKNPTGHKIIDQVIEATITDDSGDAMVTLSYHGLGTGDFIYLVSDIDEYNGFWYVTAIDVDTFKISEYSGADYVPYYQDSDIEYYQTQDHVWNSVFLPIVYKVSNDLWPVNQVDDLRTVVTQTDDNGYTNLNLSGNLKSDFESLEFIKISGASDDDLNGVFQIVEKISTSEIVINLPYAAANDFTNATVQYYYNNYQVKIKIFAGLPSSHPWESKKTYEEMGELFLTPDENNLIMFSVADYIKGQVAIKNNPLLFSFPLNLDAFTGFYISYGESYDESDGYSVGTFESAMTSDIAGSWTPETIDTLDLWTESGAGEEWTDTTTPVAQILTNSGDHSNSSELKKTSFAFVDGNSYRISYSFTRTNVAGTGSFASILITIRDTSDAVLLTKTVLYSVLSGVKTGTWEFTAGPTAARICIQATQSSLSPVYPSSTYEYQINSISLEGGTIGGFEGFAIAGKLPFKNVYSGNYADYVYTPGYPALWLSLLDRLIAVEDKYFDVSFIKNIEGDFTVIIDKYISDDLTATETVSYTDQGIGVYRIPIEGDSTYDSFCIRVAMVVDGYTVEVTEEICIDILESCEISEGFTPTDIRLLEDGSYRILE